MFCDYLLLVTLYKIGEVYFRFLCTSDFHVKTKNERFAAGGRRCRQILKYEIFASSFGRLRQKKKKMQEKACRTCSKVIFLHSTNQIINLWRCRWRCCCRRHFLNSLIKVDDSSVTSQNDLAPVVPLFVSVIQWIIYCPLDKYYQNLLSYPVDSD